MKLNIFRPKRVWGIVLRHLYLLKHSISRWIDLLYWPTVDLLLWGFITLYLQKGFYQGGKWIFQFLGALIFWNILIRAQQGLAVGFLEDIWARNLLHIFVSPLTIFEYLMGLFIYSLFKAFVASLLMAFLAFFIFNFKVWMQGVDVFLLTGCLIIFAWSIGLLTMAFILFFGQEAEILAWALALLFLPFSAVFYPVEVLPESFQSIAKLVPTSYIFETFREILLKGYTPYIFIVKAYFLVFVYFLLSVGIFVIAFNFAKKTGKITKIGE
jgi:ABC-2 type transport system permease protein